MANTKAGNVRKFGERSPQQVGQEEKSSRFMEHERGSADQANTEEFIKEIRAQSAKRTDGYPGGATMPELCDTHGEDMKKLIEAAGAADADMTALEAVAEYMATVYEDARNVKYQRGFPLETIYGLPAGHGRTRYQLVVNCTDLTSEEQDEVGMHKKGPQVTVGPFREEPKAAKQYIGHLESAIRHFHDLPDTAPVLCSGKTQLRWYADKIAEFHLTFEKSEYAITALATSLAHLPLHCVPLGADDFQAADVCIPRVRVFHPRQTRTGNAERQLHIISEELRGHTTKDLEKQLRSMPSVESAIKGARGLPAYMEKHTNSIRLVAVTEEAADNIESKVLAFPGLGEYTVQRIRPSLTNRGEDETEVIVVDKGSTINLAADLPNLVAAIQEVFTQAGLGEAAEHLKPLPATTVRPGTDPAKPETYMRVRITKSGNLFTGLASEAAYEWLGKQDRRTVRLSLPNKSRSYLLQHSDFSRTGDKFKGRRGRAAPPAAGAQQTEDIVQALESKLSNQWAKVAKGGAGDEAINELRKAVEKLEGTCKSGFTDNVEATNKVSSKVDEVKDSVIDLTEENREFQKQHLGISSEILKSFSNSNNALAKLLKGQRTPEPAKKNLRRPREASEPSDSEGGMEIDEETLSEFRRLQKARAKADERKKLEQLEQLEQLAEPRSSRSQRSRG
ncbi:hypothetical protein CYMTET_2902 [Cymbomonas tetramitiformis]|uniref:Uncharacterized protein n=1 Tax=Cymbomonas tetramitiformis TaxID=36881 RepID=A0AAE0H4C5_9CHLO|nr:hypothetical protein CYMTET_2902 [Cymbomonas tetramitiformis]